MRDEHIHLPYAELHCKTNFSFLEGASHPDELVQRAAELGYRALAITDRNSLAGVVRAAIAAKDTGLKLIVGAEVTPCDAPPVVLWATDRHAYGRLCRLLTAGRLRAAKGACRLTLADVAEYQAGLLAGVFYPAHGPLADEQNPAWARPLGAEEQAPLQRYREIFEQRCYLLGHLHRGPDDLRQLEQLQALSRSNRLPLVAAGDVHYHVPNRMIVHDVVTAIRQGITVDEVGHLRPPNAERHLRPCEDLARLFAAAPEALRRTLEVADRCRFSLYELRYEYPEELAPHGLTPLEYLVRLTWKGARKRYGGQVPEKVRRLLEHELQLIGELRYEAYFLTVWDLVRFARRRGILCQGRGSAANSAVCYCLGVTSVDPEVTDVLFERFVSRERDEAPDIDVDFEHERREEVLQYVYEKYGRERAGLAATVITYRARSAIRDVGKALGLSLDRVDALAKIVDGYRHEPDLADRCRQSGIDPDSEIARRFIYVVQQLLGFPRHLSQHVGGMVITRGPLCEMSPIENAAMEDRTVIQWDKDDLDELGILKVDCLALGMLTAIRKCFDLLSEHHQRPLTLATIPAGDPQVYNMICRADTIGVFQIESRAQMSMLPRLRPRCYYDLVIEVAIVRPGPIQGQMVHPYLRRRMGQEQVTYPNDEIKQVLDKTLGVPIFQEQAMKLAIVAAGFTPGEADQLRRAMSAWRRPGLIDQFRSKLIDGMRERGLTEEFAQQVFQQIRGFGEYGFPESHAASFALLVYVSSWLKHHYPEVFLAAMLNSQPMGFYAPAQLVRDARQHNVEVRPVDINHSHWDCTLEAVPPDRAAGPRFAVRLGLRMIGGFSTASAAAIEVARTGRPFRSLPDFVQRTRFSRPFLMRLARADAFGSLGLTRRAAMWAVLSQDKMPRSLPLFDALDADTDDREASVLQLPGMDAKEEVVADYQTTGFSLKAHPISFHRARLDELQVTPADQLPRRQNNRRVRVAGLVILRQRPDTARGITFVTLEDETGSVNLVIQAPVWKRFYQIAHRSNYWIADGKLERRDAVIHVVVYRLHDFSADLAALNLKSRDFR